jgi:hypothetical protein
MTGTRRKMEANLPDVGETTKQPDKPSEELLQRCSRCEMERAGWTGEDGRGIRTGDYTYCCQGCANDTGCTCISEASRHTGANIGAQRH